MKKDDLRLSRAFTEAPSELHDAVESAFQRGERAMKKRHKMMVALSAVAACALLLTALALAAVRLTEPRPDPVVAAQGGGAIPSAEPTQDIIDQITPEPTPTPEVTPIPTATPEVTPEPTPTPEVTPEPTPTPELAGELEIVYTQPESSYYHSVQNCSGMVGAIEWTKASAISVGKQPCPACVIGEVTITAPNTRAPESDEPCEAPVYYTAGGVYYHGNDQCSGMLNAQEHTLAEAEADGKLRCPTCQPVEPDHYDLFKQAFGQGLEALIPGYAYAYCGDATRFFGEGNWHVTDGEEVFPICQASSFLKADGGEYRTRMGSTVFEDVLCISFFSEKLDNLWPFLSGSEAGALALAEKDEAVEDMIEKLNYAGPLNLEEGNVWVTIGSDGVIRELEVYYIDPFSDVTVTLAWTLSDGEYVFSGTVE